MVLVTLGVADAKDEPVTHRGDAPAAEEHPATPTKAAASKGSQRRQRE
jgi:hypothetical protein